MKDLNVLQKAIYENLRGDASEKTVDQGCCWERAVEPAVSRGRGTTKSFSLCSLLLCGS